MNGPRVAVFSTSWTEAPQREIGYAARSISGAVSRLAAVDVFVPGDRPAFGDGAFDVTPVGASVGAWLSAGGGRVPPSRYRAVLVEAGDDDVGALETSVSSTAPGVPVLAMGAAPITGETGRGDPRPRPPSARGGLLAVDLDAAGRPEHGGGQGSTAMPAVHHVGLYARVHPDAKHRRHYGLGSIPHYLLVLGDRSRTATGAWPSERARWLLARFPREYIVVVEGGAAHAWRSRSCVARFAVHTRMDLWILMAGARGVVDLLPGEVYARECVESLRYGVPVAVRGGSGADGLAQGGGALRFSSTAELLSCIEALSDPPTREALASAGRDLAERWYGDPDGLVARLAGVLGLPLPRPRRATVGP